MAKKRSSERRLEIFEYRYRDVNPFDIMAREVGKFRHSIRPDASRKSDNCRAHANIEKEVTGKWIFDPGSGDVKGIDVPASYVHGHVRKSRVPGKPGVKIRPHYRLKKRFPDYCKKQKKKGKMK